MMSDNPHSGFYEAETSRTLDRSGGDPTCNQGGLCICEPVVCVDQGGGKSNCTVDEQVAPPLACTHGGGSGGGLYAGYDQHYKEAHSIID